jgi:hypothetical protein
LKLIEDGQVSLLQAPRNSETAADGDNNKRWVSKQILMMSLDTRGLLEECWKQFNTKYANVPESTWSSVMDAEISEDLSYMQMQPAIMQEYRRYVVIKGPGNDHIEWDRDGVSYSSALS